MENIKINFIEEGNQKERMKKPVKVLNISKEMGMESLQEIEDSELTPEKSLDIDGRALENPECVSIVFGRPHTGEYVPISLWENMKEEGKKTMAFLDRGTQVLFRSEKVPSIGTKMSRYVIDLNRNIDTVNQVSLQGTLNWNVSAYRTTIYEEDKRPTSEEVLEMAKSFYLPYYNSMMGVVGTLFDRRKDKENERVLLIDGHSFSTNKVFDAYYKDATGITELKKLPLFIIGDNNSKSCDQDISKAFADALEKNFKELDQELQESIRGKIDRDLIGFNGIFKGAQNVNFWGHERQEFGLNVLQLECDESMYIDETDNDYFTGKYDFEKLSIVQRLLEKTCKDIDHLLKNNPPSYEK